MTQSKKSDSEQVLTNDGGLSGQTLQPQPLSSLAQEDALKQSSALAQQGDSKVFILRGSQPLSSGKKPVLTERNGSDIPNSTLAGTANWVLKMLQGRGLIEFGESANGENYQARFSTSIWKVENGVLTLKDKV
jgi:hypothetical protein